MWNKIASKFATSNTSAWIAWMVPLVVGLATDPQGYLSSHPRIAAYYAAAVIVVQGLYKAWSIYANRHQATPALIPPASVPADKPVVKAPMPSPHHKRK